MFAFVGGEQKFDLIHSPLGEVCRRDVFGHGFGDKGDVKLGVDHVEVAEFLFDGSCEQQCCGAALLGELLGGFKGECLGAFERSLDFGAAFFGVFETVELEAHFFGFGEDGGDVDTVFSFEVFEGFETFLDGVESSGVGFDGAVVACEFARDVFDGVLGFVESFDQGLNPWVVVRGFGEQMDGLADPSIGRCVPVEEVFGAGGGIDNFGGVFEELEFGLKFFFFAGDEFCGFNFLELEAQEIDAMESFPDVVFEACEFGSQRFYVGKTFAHGGSQFCEHSELVEHVEVAVGVEQADVFVLSADVDQAARDFAQSVEGGQTAVDEHLVATASADDPSHEELAVSGFDAKFVKEAGDAVFVLAEFKDALDDGLVFVGPDDIGGGSTGEEEIEGVDDDGFSGPGFAAENGESAVKRDLEVVNDGEVSDDKMGQHGFIFSEGRRVILNISVLNKFSNAQSAKLSVNREKSCEMHFCSARGIPRLGG